MRKGIIFVVSGPSGSGKTTLIKSLLGKRKFRGNLTRVVTCTTRAPRTGENDGKDYIFLKPQEFRIKIKRGNFLEWQKVLGYYYGTPKEQVKEGVDSGKDVFLCIDVKGAKTLKDKRGFKFVRIFVMPSENNWQAMLKTRLTYRGSENRQQINKRLKLAKAEIKQAKYYDYIMINKDINKAVNELTAIVLAERMK